MRDTAPEIKVDDGNVSRHDKHTNCDRVYIQTHLSREDLLAISHQVNRALCGEDGLVFVVDIKKLPAWGFDWETHIQFSTK